MFGRIIIQLLTTVVAVRCAFLEGVCDMCICSKPQSEIEYLHVNCSVRPRFAKLLDLGNATENTGIRVSMQHMNLTELKRYVRFESLNVTKLSLDYNNIKFVPPHILNKFQNLSSLSLTHNEIADIAEDAFSGLTEVKVLNLSRNALQSIDISSLQDMKKLQTLDLRENNIFSMESTYNSHHNSSLIFYHLKYLDLSNNKLTEFPIKALESFPNIEFLNVSYNSLKSIPNNSFSKLTQIVELDLSKNRLTEIELQAFSSLNNISKLNLRHNLISVVDFINQLNKLTYLDLSFNSLTKFNMSLSNSSIKTLLVGNNGLTSLEPILQQLPQLEKIDASWNQCNRLPHTLGPNLKELILDASAITKLQPRSGGNGSLRYLSLSELPRLTSLPSNVFVGIFNNGAENGSCNKLRISKTGLENIDKTALKNLNICELDLSWNKLTNLPEDTFEWDKIVKLDLQNNAWHCSCQMQWLLDKVVAKMYNTHQDLLEDLRCTSPHYLVGTRLVHWYNKSEPMLCSKEMKNAHLVTVMSSTSMIIVFILLGAIAVGLVILGFYLQRKAIRQRRTKKNRRF